MARGYSYIIKRDFGFAPNPFQGILTLATCKPGIRKHAQVGDYLIGNSPKINGNKLIFIAKVSEKTTFDEYWNDPKFQNKKAVMNGSFKTLYGDNIYHMDKGKWVQADSHHSNVNGEVNIGNLNHDTGTTDCVLICKEYFYLGCSMIDISEEFSPCICHNRGYHVVDEADCLKLWEYLTDKYPEGGLIDYPNLFRTFTRYVGEK